MPEMNENATQKYKFLTGKVCIVKQIDSDVL